MRRSHLGMKAIAIIKKGPKLSFWQVYRFSASLNSKTFVLECRFSTYIYAWLCRKELWPFSIKFMWCVVSLSFSINAHRFHLHENNGTLSIAPNACVEKQLQYFLSILFSILWLKSSLLSAEATRIFYFHSKFGDHASFVQCIKYADMAHVSVMHVEYIQNSDGEISGSLFWSQRRI
jgi:hypothetical protein